MAGSELYTAQSLKNQLLSYDVMRAEGLPDFRAPPAIPKFIDNSQDTYELSSCDSFEPLPDDF